MTCTANHVGEAREARSSTVESRELVSFSRAILVVATRKAKVAAERLAIVVIYYGYILPIAGLPYKARVHCRGLNRQE